MIQVSTPDADGKIIHTVQPYQTLITIAQAYRVSVDTILALNGLQMDWPLQIGQKLVISSNVPHPEGSATPWPARPHRDVDPRQRWQVLPQRAERRNPVVALPENTPSACTI